MNQLAPTESSKQNVSFETLTIVGVGLLGGSVALAAKRSGAARRIIGVGRNLARLSEACAAGVIDQAQTDLRQAASESNLIVLATPVDQIVSFVREAATACRPGTILTDVGSTKAHRCRELAHGLPAVVTFVGAHPIAGSHKQGWQHSHADLFDERVCVVTPLSSSDRKAVDAVATFWRRLGLSVFELSPEAHDQALAQTSHLPHVVASALARTLTEENRPFAATGFADTTRIAAGDPALWIPILLDNVDSILISLQGYTQQLADFQDALSRRDVHELQRLWNHGKAIRDSLRIRKTGE